MEVKEVKEKRLPELDDDFAVEAGGYDSLDELRAELEQRIGEAQEREIEGEFREAAVDAAVAAAEGRGPARARPRQGPRDVAPHLAPAGRAGRSTRSSTSQMTGKTEEELVTEAEPDAELALKREAVLSAIVAAEGIEVSDEEIADALREAAGPDASDKQLKRAHEARPRAGRRRGAARGHRDAQGRGPARRERQADPGRAGRRAREALDARQGGQGRGRRADLDARASPR